MVIRGQEEGAQERSRRDLRRLADGAREGGAAGAQGGALHN